MRVLKVVAEGLTTSFRYPHFMQQIHPSYPMPPPATIYGHISSALGEWFDPIGVRFAYHFTYQGQVKDKEHIIVLSPSSGTFSGTQIPKIQEGNVTPFDRDLLFQPRLTLYINRPEWADAFRSPRYAVVLGRSQDLFAYTSVELVECQKADRAYFEHALVLHTMAFQIGRGVTMLMPRYLDNTRNRAPHFERYIVVQDRVHLPNEEAYQFAGTSAGPYWVDPTTAEEKGAHRGLAFLDFTGEGA